MREAWHAFGVTMTHPGRESRTPPPPPPADAGAVAAKQTKLTPKQARQLAAVIESDLRRRGMFASHVFANDLARLHRLQNGAPALVSKLWQIDDAMGWMRSSALAAALHNTPPVHRDAARAALEAKAADPEAVDHLSMVDDRTNLVIPRRLGPPPAPKTLSHLIVRAVQAVDWANTRRLGELATLLEWWLADGVEQAVDVGDEVDSPA